MPKIDKPLGIKLICAFYLIIVIAFFGLAGAIFHNILYVEIGTILLAINLLLAAGIWFGNKAAWTFSLAFSIVSFITCTIAGAIYVTGVVYYISVPFFALVAINIWIIRYLNLRKTKEFFKMGLVSKSNIWGTAAVVILLLVLLLGGLFSLGCFGCGNRRIVTSCIAASGYYCQSAVYSHATGGISVVVGQDTGTSWSDANFVFVPQGTLTSSGGLPSISFASYPANISAGSSGVASGQTISVSLPVENVKAPVPIGTVATGTIWVEYTTSSNSTSPSYAYIATLNVKAS